MFLYYPTVQYASNHTHHTEYDELCLRGLRRRGDRLLSLVFRLGSCKLSRSPGQRGRSDKTQEFINLDTLTLIRSDLNPRLIMSALFGMVVVPPPVPRPWRILHMSMCT